MPLDETNATSIPRSENWALKKKERDKFSRKKRSYNPEIFPVLIILESDRASPIRSRFDEESIM